MGWDGERGNRQDRTGIETAVKEKVEKQDERVGGRLKKKKKKK